MAGKEASTQTERTEEKEVLKNTHTSNVGLGPEHREQPGRSERQRPLDRVVRCLPIGKAVKRLLAGAGCSVQAGGEQPSASGGSVAAARRAPPKTSLAHQLVCPVEPSAIGPSHWDSQGTANRRATAGAGAGSASDSATTLTTSRVSLGSSGSRVSWASESARCCFRSL